ncbi:MAG: hypothetical protein ACUVXG_11585 [Anaerolineae bacterium]
MPDAVIAQSEGRLIAQRRITERHLLHVVYRIQDGDRVIVPFYPARRERCEAEICSRRGHPETLPDATIDHAGQVESFIAHFSPEGCLVLLEVLDASEFLASVIKATLRRESEELTLPAG